MAINKMAYAVNTQTVIWPYFSLFQTKNFKTEPYSHQFLRPDKNPVVTNSMSSDAKHAVYDVNFMVFVMVKHYGRTHCVTVQLTT